jgi:predicted nucleic acid-binding protein
VFIDSSAFFSLLDTDDRDHLRARQIQESMIQRGALDFTSNFVVAECHALILNRIGRRMALEFLDSLASTVTVLAVTPADEARAIEIIRQYDDKNFSYVDASSFAIMERFGIRDVFGFDRHFTQYGFRALQVP